MWNTMSSKKSKTLFSPKQVLAKSWALLDPDIRVSPFDSFRSQKIYAIIVFREFSKDVIKLTQMTIRSYFLNRIVRCEFSTR